MISQSLDSKIKSYQKTIDNSNKKAEKLNHHLKDFEESTLILKTRESEIQDLKDKFNEIEGVSELMEKRVDQIYAMFNKVETLRKEMDETDDRLQGMYNDTDRKMKEFADFIKAVDKNNPILKQFNGDLSSAMSINENIIKTVRDLSEKGWAADEISKKLMVDENSVRLIINTTSI